MSKAKKLFDFVQVGNSIETLYKVPNNEICLAKSLIVCNTDTAAAHEVTFHIVKKGDVAKPANIACIVQIEPGDYTSVDFDQVLDMGDSIQAVADAAEKINVRGSGLEGVF